MSLILLIAAIICFILGIFLDQHIMDLLFGGLALFAAAHLPLGGIIDRVR